MLNFLPSQAIELKSLDELDIPTLTEICQFVANSFEFQPDEKVITTKDTTFTTGHSSYRHPKGSEGKIVKYQLAANLYSVAFSNQKLYSFPATSLCRVTKKTVTVPHFGKVTEPDQHDLLLKAKELLIERGQPFDPIGKLALYNFELRLQQCQFDCERELVRTMQLVAEFTDILSASLICEYTGLVETVEDEKVTPRLSPKEIELRWGWYKKAVYRQPLIQVTI